MVVFSRIAKITIYPRKSDFTLFCKCGTCTTYGSSKDEEWDEDTVFQCRHCGAKYSAVVKVKAHDVSKRDR